MSVSLQNSYPVSYTHLDVYKRQAKNYTALRSLNAIIREDLLRKEYLCITAGVPPKGRHVAWLRHDERNNKVHVRANQAEGYKQIITEVQVVDTYGPFALCRIGLVTGRTDQIRAHLAFLGAPILGDIKYGNRRLNEKMKVRGQMLLSLIHIFPVRSIQDFLKTPAPGGHSFE